MGVGRTHRTEMLGAALWAFGLNPAPAFGAPGLTSPGHPSTQQSTALYEMYPLNGPGHP